MWLTKMFACERVFEPMSVNFWPHHPTNVAFVWGSERGQLCDGGWGLCLWNVVSWWKGWSWTNAVYLANQTCWSPTDVFTQGLNREIHLSVYFFGSSAATFSHSLALKLYKSVDPSGSLFFPSVCLTTCLSLSFYPLPFTPHTFLFFCFSFSAL